MKRIDWKTSHPFQDVHHRSYSNSQRTNNTKEQWWGNVDLSMLKEIDYKISGNIINSSVISLSVYFFILLFFCSIDFLCTQLASQMVSYQELIPLLTPYYSRNFLYLQSSSSSFFIVTIIIMLTPAVIRIISLWKFKESQN